MTQNFVIIGGDKRLQFLSQMLISKGYNVTHIFKEENENISQNINIIKNAEVIVLPIPLTADSINVFAPFSSNKLKIKELSENITDNQLIFGGGIHCLLDNKPNYINLLDNAEMTLKNAMSTAEGTLKIIIESFEKNIYGSNFAVLGYGRIAKFLCRYLYTLGGKVTVIARKPFARTEAELCGYKTSDFGNLAKTLQKADVIINTVPSLVLGEDIIKKISKEKLIIDLASKPGGVDFKAAEKFKIKAIQALSLPGKYSPYSSAEYIAEAIIYNLKERRFLC